MGSRLRCEWEGAASALAARLRRRSGGKWAYVAPGERFTHDLGLVGLCCFGAAGLWPEIRASHPDNRYRLMLSLGRGF